MRTRPQAAIFELQPLEQRTFFSAAPAQSPGTAIPALSPSAVIAAAAPTDVLTKAIRQDLLNHWNGSNKADLQAKLNANKVTAFDDALLTYMKGRSGQYFYWKTGDVAAIQDFINAHLDTSTTIDNANHIVSHLFPNGNSEAYDVDLGSGDINWATTNSNPEFAFTLNRQEYWSDLSQAYILTGDSKYVTELTAELSSWSQQNPALANPAATQNGPAWQPLSVATRANTWTWVYQQLLGSSAWTGSANTLFLYKLYQQADRLRKVTPYELTSNRSLFEAQALLQIAHLVPEFDNATDWKTYGRKLLFGAMDAQLNPDGGHAESSPGYAGNVILALLEMYSLDSKTGDGSTWAGSRITKLQNAAKAHVQLLTPDAKLAALSDTYRGVIGPFWDRPRIILNDTADFPAAKPRLRDVWLFGATASNSLLGSPVNPPLQDRGKTYAMPQSGYYVMRSGADANARQVTFDAGPTGGAHGHFDLLNFELFGYGQTLISDPGLYTYDDSAQRAWAISTPAHNTISIDNTSHAAIEGVGNPDIQSSSINSVAGGYQITASHKGYKALAGSPLVTRSIWYDGNGVMLVVDWGEASASHTFTQSFLLPTANTGSDLANGTIHSNGGNGRVLLTTLLQSGQQSHKQTKINGTGSPNIFVSDDPTTGIAKDATRYYVDQTGNNATFITLVNAYNTTNAPDVTAQIVGTAPPAPGAGGAFQVQLFRGGVKKELITFYPRPGADFRPAAPIAGSNDIAWDKLGRLHMVWQDTSEQDLKYSVRGTDGKWSIPQTVDSGQFAGGWPSLAVDSNNNPVVAYFDGNGGDLKYASLVGGVWTIETVDSSGSTGLYPSMVLGAGDTPMISYYRRTGGDLRLAVHKSTGWKISTVDDAGDVGRCTSIALNPNSPGTVAIAYDDSNTGSKKFAYQGASDWVIQTVDSSTPAGGGYTSLAYEPFTSTGKTYKPTISYYDSSQTALKFARFDGSIWNNEIVATQGVQGLYTSLYYDTNNQANILFFKKSTVRAYRVRGSFGSWATSSLGTGGREIQTAKRSNGTVAFTNLDSDGLRVEFL